MIRFQMTGRALVIRSAAVLALTVACGMSGWMDPFSSLRRKNPEIATAPVRRADLEVTETTAGRIDSAERTIITCNLDAILGASWGASTILSLVPEGTMVKKGDVLCTLDATHYEEVLRLQEIQVGMVEADLTKARLDLEVARLAVDEYRKGLLEQTLTQLRGAIALQHADHERATDRLAWAERMLQKGYLSRAQVSTETSNVAHLAHNLMLSEKALEMFEKWTVPKNLKSLDAAVLMAEAILKYQSSRMALSRDRLQYFREQVEACTIRAPHDGLLIYYTYPRYPTYRIQEGTVVLRTQKLFYLPDLNHLEVVTPLHETVLRNLRPGLKALVEVEGMPGRVIDGALESIPTLPTLHWYSDARYFESKVSLRNIPAGLRPGMTASVKLVVKKPHVLVIPVSALACEAGEDVCYVESSGKLIRRVIRTGQSTHDLVEVVAGLNEDDQVVLNPPLNPQEESLAVPAGL